MEFNISDLLDDLQDLELGIHLETGASEERIKELTMKKIHKYETPRRRGTALLFKVALVAAVLASLAIPVMAATGFRFTDWLEGMGKESVKDQEVRYSTWEATEGFWQVSLSANDLTREGMNLVCREVQDTPVTGSLILHGGGWLEWWNGETFEKIGEFSGGENREVKNGGSLEEAISWADACGTLQPGRYRLMKNFTYTYSDGTTSKLVDWAEFRIFNEEMTPYVKQCKDALRELRTRENSHISFVRYRYDEDPKKESSRISSQIWRSGEEYLICNTVEDYITDAGGTYAELLLGEKGYACRNVSDIFSGETAWESDKLLTPEENQFDLWYDYFSLDETQVGEVCVEEQKIVVLTSYLAESGDMVWKEFTYLFDDVGNLIGAQVNYLPDGACTEEEKRLNCSMDVMNTTPEKIAEIIGNQNVT